MIQHLSVCRYIVIHLNVNLKLQMAYYILPSKTWFLENKSDNINNSHNNDSKSNTSETIEK